MPIRGHYFLYLIKYRACASDSGIHFIKSDGSSLRNLEGDVYN